MALAAVAVGFGSGALVPAQADVVTTAQQIYSTPGVHLVNGRYWRTTCAVYSSTVVRCTTDIYATKVFLDRGRWYTNNDWVFNNLSYLPSPRANWATNNLGNPGSWAGADGRQWRSECETPKTGRGACRNYAFATVASLKNGKVVQEKVEVFNSVVLFATSSSPWVKSIPAAAPARSDVPVATAPRPVFVAPPAGVTRPVTPTPPVRPSGGVAPISRNSCPASAPIKGNADSGIYHKPGQQFYARTNPEVCFASDSDAVRAGFRKSKR
ncbi:hypothetical protein EAX62_13245 [Tessaracoccus antarcticus]|uniref:Uncharacterized protein n=1 Tax=Tessaracoccus antarcticus TaxID=2479848 RepID=A0A3M0GLJ9_9ACTN|nr:hypothetical protein EAX62_13245 [Tessaracoccus antarcticus]